MQPFVDALTALFALVAAHKVGISLAMALVLAYWVFNAYVSSLLKPDDPKSEEAARWRFLNQLAGNLDKVAKVLHVPGSDTDAPKP
jgi:hypothetical protein